MRLDVHEIDFEKYSASQAKRTSLHGSSLHIELFLRSPGNSYYWMLLSLISHQPFVI